MQQLFLKTSFMNNEKWKKNVSVIFKQSADLFRILNNAHLIFIIYQI